MWETFMVANILKTKQPHRQQKAVWEGSRFDLKMGIQTSVCCLLQPNYASKENLIWKVKPVGWKHFSYYSQVGQGPTVVAHSWSQGSLHKLRGILFSQRKPGTPNIALLDTLGMQTGSTAEFWGWSSKPYQAICLGLSNTYYAIVAKGLMKIIA